MRYGIIEHHEDGPDSPHPYFVVDSQAPSISLGMLGPKYTEAEAGLLAWALNMAAMGMTLYAGHTSNEVLTAYDGSVRGVA